MWLRPEVSFRFGVVAAGHIDLPQRASHEDMLLLDNDDDNHWRACRFLSTAAYYTPATYVPIRMAFKATS